MSEILDFTSCDEFNNTDVQNEMDTNGAMAWMLGRFDGLK